MKIQEHLLYIAELIITRMNSLHNIIGVMAEWKETENTAYISFYFENKPKEDDIEKASDACGEIIAHCSNAMLKEYYITWDRRTPLPESQFWAYTRP